MKKNGFTLIELLAVIVILAIIALIATPTILGIIEKSKLNAAEISAQNYADALEQQMVANEINGGVSLEDGNYSVQYLNSNLNIVMKFLTSVTIVLSIPTMIASFFGMNVPVPLSNLPHAFALILGISFALSSLVALFMAKKKMF